MHFKRIYNIKQTSEKYSKMPFGLLCLFNRVDIFFLHIFISSDVLWLLNGKALDFGSFFLRFSYLQQSSHVTCGLVSLFVSVFPEHIQYFLLVEGS